MIGNEEASPTRQAWLDQLKKGDAAVMRFTRKNSFEYEYYAVTVDLVSDIGGDGPRRIYAGGNVYNREGKWFDSHVLVEPTAEALNEVERTKCIDKMVELRWKRLPVAVLVKVVSLIEADTWIAELLEKKRLELEGMTTHEEDK